MILLLSWTSYWFQDNYLSPKINWCTNKSKIKYPLLNTYQVSSVRKKWWCNTRCATNGVLGSQVQSPLGVNFWLNLIFSSVRNSLLPTLPQSSKFQEKLKWRQLQLHLTLQISSGQWKASSYSPHKIKWNYINFLEALEMAL